MPVYYVPVKNYFLYVGKCKNVDNKTAESRISINGEYNSKTFRVDLYFIKDFAEKMKIVSDTETKIQVIYDFDFYEAYVDILRNESPLAFCCVPEQGLAYLSTSGSEEIGENE